MLGNTIFLIGLLVAAGIGFIYFRDLGDVSQMIMKVKRRNMIRFIRHEYRLLTIGLGATALMALAHFGLGGGPRWLFWIALLVLAFLYGFPWIWVHLGLRNQRNSAKYYSIDEAKPIMNNMTHYDDRLATKTYVWGINISKDAVCYTDDFIGENDGLINATIGGRDIVVSYDPKYESVGAWYNDSGAPVTHIDFFGKSDQGQHQRIETLKSGLFWHVWVEFFQHTDINRVGSPVDDDTVVTENEGTT
jgi:hypothetical protein